MFPGVIYALLAGFLGAVASSSAKLSLGADYLKGEVDVLRKQVDFLAEENGKLVGHQNLNQKIQYLVKLKKENTKLIEVFFCLMWCGILVSSCFICGSCTAVTLYIMWSLKV
ncbi:KI15B protein, partial [Atractosteus spatula]|nr:KI15B protein [Atractosteus spatula]